MNDTTDDPKYPDVYVQLTGQSPNGGAIMAAVADGLRQHGVPASEIQQMRAEMMSGDYKTLVRTAMRWVTVG